MKTKKYRDYISSFINNSKEVGFSPVEYHVLEYWDLKRWRSNRRVKYIVTLKHSKFNQKFSFCIDFTRWKEDNMNYHNKNYWTVDVCSYDPILAVPFSWGASSEFYDLKKMHEEGEGKKELIDWLLKVVERFSKCDQD